MVFTFIAKLLVLKTQAKKPSEKSRRHERVASREAAPL